MQIQSSYSNFEIHSLAERVQLTKGHSIWADMDDLTDDIRKTIQLKEYSFLLHLPILW